MKLRLLCSLFAALALAISLAQTTHAGPVRAGFAERDITPEIGMERPGGYGKVFHKTLHDPCKVRAAVFDDGTKTVAIVGLDALLIRRPQVTAARSRIHAQTGIAAEAILIAASHSHSSGPTGMILPGEFDHASPEVQKLAYEQSSNADPRYLALVENRIVEAVVAAYQERREAELGFGSGHEDKIAFNRRFRMKNGRTMTHPRVGNPDMLEPAGPIDPEVGVLAAWDASGEKKPLGCIVNYACHATTSPPGISANYVWYLEKVMQDHLGKETVIVFLPGASGDVTQVDNRYPFQRPGGEAETIRVGGRIGAEALRTLFLMDRTTECAVDFQAEVLRIPHRAPAPERVAEARKLLEEGPGKNDPQRQAEYTFAKETVLLEALLAKQTVRDVEVQAVQVGPAVFLTTPAEYFCQFGLDQKAASPFPFTWPVSLANDCVGYVPTEEALSETGGGYETRLTSYSNLVPEAGRLMADTGVKLARQMTPGKPPQGAPAPKFSGGAWTYGNVPAQVR